MIPEIGHFALVMALAIAIVQLTVPMVGSFRNNAAYMAVARPSALAQFIFIAIAFACLTTSFVTHDFSVKYTAVHSNSLLPLLYRVSAVWGGHEGSMLLWMLMLSGWGAAVAIFSGKLPAEMAARVLSVMAFVSIGFLLFTIITSNPFERLLPPPLDGRDLNPLLQDFGLAIHPPMLYMGYVGFSVAFSFAIAALIGGKLDATWARWSRPWTTVAWMFLTFGIALGSWWAYYELGWGGWWFWDPVENASFMPWLVGTALVHSLAVTEKRGSFKNWTVLLAICTFSLSLLGTFLVRSGVLTSVHSFATDPERGLAILIFLAIVVGSSLLLYAWRAPKVGLGGRFSVLSRETFLLTNNVLFIVACGAVLLGTLYPLILDGLGYGKISVGPPYFNAVFVPIMVLVVFMLGVGPVSRWKKTQIPDLVARLKWAFGISVVCGLLMPFFAGGWTVMTSLGFWMAAWAMSTVVANMVHRIRQNMKGGVTGKISLSYYGMQLAHFGVGVFIIGATMVGGYEKEKDVRMDIGDTVEVGGYTFRFDGVTSVPGPNYQADRGRVVVTYDGREFTVMFPEKRFYTVQQQVMTEAAIHTGLTGDLYVSLGEPVGRGGWSVRVYHKPFVTWIWAGCALMGLGGLLAICDRRYRLARKKQPKSTKEDQKASATSDTPLATGMSKEVSSS